MNDRTKFLLKNCQNPTLSLNDLKFPLQILSSLDIQCFFSNHMEMFFFARNSNFLVPSSFQPDRANLWYFEFRQVDLTEFKVWNLKGSTTPGCNATRIIKSKFAVKTQLLCIFFLLYFASLCRGPFIIQTWLYDLTKFNPKYV